MGQKRKTPDLAPPSPPSPRTTRRALLREPGRVFFAAQNPESCCAAIKFAVAFASLSDPRAVFSAGDGHADRAGPLPWNKHLVLPGGGARPPVGLLSLTSFSAGDLVPRPCMSSSYGCASRRLCLLRHRVSSALVPTSFPFQQVLHNPRKYGGEGPSRTRSVRVIDLLAYICALHNAFMR